MQSRTVGIDAGVLEGQLKAIETSSNYEIIRAAVKRIRDKSFTVDETETQPIDSAGDGPEPAPDSVQGTLDRIDAKLDRLLSEQDRIERREIGWLNDIWVAVDRVPQRCADEMGKRLDLVERLKRMAAIGETFTITIGK